MLSILEHGQLHRLTRGHMGSQGMRFFTLSSYACQKALHSHSAEEYFYQRVLPTSTEQNRQQAVV